MATKDYKLLQICPNDSKWPKTTPKSSKYLKISPYRSKQVQMDLNQSKIVQFGPNWSYLFKTGKTNIKKITNIKIKIKQASGLVYMEFVWKSNIDLNSHRHIFLYLHMPFIEKNIYFLFNMIRFMHFLGQQVLAYTLFV